MAECGEVVVKVEVSPEAWQAVIGDRDRLATALRTLVDEIEQWDDPWDEDPWVRLRSAAKRILPLLDQSPCTD